MVNHGYFMGLTLVIIHLYGNNPTFEVELSIFLIIGICYLGTPAYLWKKFRCINSLHKWISPILVVTRICYKREYRMHRSWNVEHLHQILGKACQSIILLLFLCHYLTAIVSRPSFLMLVTSTSSAMKPRVWFMRLAL